MAYPLLLLLSPLLIAGPTTYYQVLGVFENVSQSKIQQTYQQKKAELLREKDIRPNFERELKELDVAYQVLKDPELRARYDQSEQVKKQRGLGFQNRRLYDSEYLPNYYSVLGVDENDKPEKIEEAYQKEKALLQKKNDPGVDEFRLSEIEEAYDTLKNSGRRKKYDELRRRQTRVTDIAEDILGRVPNDKSAKGAFLKLYYSVHDSEIERARSMRSPDRPVFIPASDRKLGVLLAFREFLRRNPDVQLTLEERMKALETFSEGTDLPEEFKGVQGDTLRRLIDPLLRETSAPLTKDQFLLMFAQEYSNTFSFLDRREFHDPTAKSGELFKKARLQRWIQAYQERFAEQDNLIEAFARWLEKAPSSAPPCDDFLLEIPHYSGLLPKESRARAIAAGFSVVDGMYRDKSGHYLLEKYAEEAVPYLMEDPEATKKGFKYAGLLGKMRALVNRSFVGRDICHETLGKLVDSLSSNQRNELLRSIKR